jgi:hypothetical protein
MRKSTSDSGSSVSEAANVKIEPEEFAITYKGERYNNLM